MLVLVMVHESQESHQSQEDRYSSAGMDAAHYDACALVAVVTFRVIVPLNAPSASCCAALCCAVPCFSSECILSVVLLVLLDWICLCLLRCAAVQCCAVLCCAVQYRAVLRCRVLCCAVLCCAVPCRAVLCVCSADMNAANIVIRCAVLCCHPPYAMLPHSAFIVTLLNVSHPSYCPYCWDGYAYVCCGSAVLCCAVLCCAALRCVVLCCAISLLT